MLTAEQVLAAQKANLQTLFGHARRPSDIEDRIGSGEQLSGSC